MNSVISNFLTVSTCAHTLVIYTLFQNSIEHTTLLCAYEYISYFDSHAIHTIYCCFSLYFCITRKEKKDESFYVCVAVACTTFALLHMIDQFMCVHLCSCYSCSISVKGERREKKIVMRLIRLQTYNIRNSLLVEFSKKN